MKITLKLLIDNNIPVAELPSYEQQVELATRLISIDLSNLGITQIECLEFCNQVKTLQLQFNQLTKIENIDSLLNLEYLSLNNNEITKVQGIKNLPNMYYLNLSNNQIIDLDYQELPKSLVILNMKNNPCCQKEDYRKNVISNLRELVELDKTKVTQFERFESIGVKIPQELYEYQQSLQQSQKIKETQEQKSDLTFLTEPEASFYQYLDEVTDRIKTDCKLRRFKIE